MRWLIITTLIAFTSLSTAIAANDVNTPAALQDNIAAIAIPVYGYSNYGYQNWYTPYRPYYRHHGYGYAYPHGPYGYYAPRYYGYRYPYNYWDYRYNYFPRRPFFYGPHYPRYWYWPHRNWDWDRD